MQVLGPLLTQMNERMRAFFGDVDRETLGMDPVGFMMDLPLTGVLNFQGSDLPASPEQIVEELLAGVHGIA